MSRKIEKIFEELPQIGRITGHINFIRGCALLVPTQKKVIARPSKMVLRHMTVEDHYTWGEFRERKLRGHSVAYGIVIGKLDANPEPSPHEYLACVRNVPLFKDDKIYQVFTIADGFVEDLEFIGNPISCVVDNRRPNESTKKCGKRLAKKIAESLSHWDGNTYRITG